MEFNRNAQTITTFWIVYAELPEHLHILNITTVMR